MDTAYFAENWKLKTENNKKSNKKVIVHVFGIVYKPKIIAYGQWIVPDVHPGKKNVENATQETQYPNTTYISMALLSLITAQSSSSHLRTPKAKIPKVEKTKN